MRFVIVPTLGELPWRLTSPSFTGKRSRVKHLWLNPACLKYGSLLESRALDFSSIYLLARFG